MTITNLGPLTQMLEAADPAYVGIRIGGDPPRVAHDNHLGLTAQQITDAEALMAGWTDPDDIYKAALAALKPSRKLARLEFFESEIALRSRAEARLRRLNYTAKADALAAQIASANTLLDQWVADQLGAP